MLAAEPPVLGFRGAADAGCRTINSLQLEPHCVILLNRMSDLHHDYKPILPIQSNKLV